MPVTPATPLFVILRRRYPVVDHRVWIVIGTDQITRQNVFVATRDPDVAEQLDPLPGALPQHSELGKQVGGLVGQPDGKTGEHDEAPDGYPDEDPRPRHGAHPNPPRRRCEGASRSSRREKRASPAALSVAGVRTGG